MVVRIDSRSCGLGDAWMRLLALATLCELRKGGTHTIYPPPVLVPLAKRLFADYFETDYDGAVDIEMQHLGLRHILPGLLRGKAYYSPFHWILRESRTKTTLKDRLNDAAFAIAVNTTRLSVPNRMYKHEYQGFMEMQGLAPFRTVGLQEFKEGMSAVLLRTKHNLHKLFPRPEIALTDLVFPSSNAHTMMSPQFASEHFPDAVFAFHQKDRDAAQFSAAGLSVVLFGNPPEDMLRLIAKAKKIYSTDSFSSHLIQTWRDNCYVMLTEMKAEMTVVPKFPEAQIVHSLAPCHPCRHRARSSLSSVCDAGYYYCRTWEIPQYVSQIESAVRRGSRDED